ncbi:MAG: LapA family protein [Gammaproteobacteria bacterium]|jgi:uncharacterized integral membrane protein|nr:LapA family protein [Gammaproteobacteria bacterium]MBT5602138.1 LapA family protein [Gammaproteobacteria bacterium]MBT6243940.1 LapA family protein [Gammaproteobacteria bacterium]
MSWIKKQLLKISLAITFLLVAVIASENSDAVQLRFLEFESPYWPVSWWLLTAFVAGFALGNVSKSWSNLRSKPSQSQG